MTLNYTPFQKRFEEITQKAPAHPTWKIWRNSFLFSVAVFLIVFLLHGLQASQFGFRQWNKSFADAGMILIGLSFALSGVCYFWNFADTKIIYRKDLGLMGFYMVLVHGIMSFFFGRRISWQGYLQGEGGASFLFALFSLLIFVMMALISNKYAIHELGGKVWRAFLRVGYIAFIFGYIHAALRGIDTPLEWAIFVFGAAVIFLRIALFVDTTRKKASK